MDDFFTKNNVIENDRVWRKNQMTHFHRMRARPPVLGVSPTREICGFYEGASVGKRGRLRFAKNDVFAEEADREAKRWISTYEKWRDSKRQSLRQSGQISTDLE